MEELLQKYNYVQASDADEWNKDVWTIRLYTTEIEAFNTPRINTPGKYYKCPSNLKNLEDIILDIESFIR